MNAHVRDNLNATGVATVTTAGDMTYASGANALSRLAISTIGKGLRVATGATAPQWHNSTPYLDFSVAETTIANNTETTVYTFSVPANTIGSANVLEIECIGLQTHNIAGTGGHTFRLKYGGTTMVTVTEGDNASSSATAYLARCRFLLKGAGTTSSQKAAGYCVSATNGGSAVLAGTVGNGTAAIDNTSAQTLLITFQNTANSASVSYTHLATFVRLLSV